MRNKPLPRVTTLWCPIPDDDTAYEVRGSYAGYGDAVEVSSPEILIDDRWIGIKDLILYEIVSKVLQPAAEEAAATEVRKMRDDIQAQIDQRWDDERKERQLERARRLLVAE